MWLIWLIALDVQQPGSGLGPDAAEAVVHYLGEWGLRILLLALSVSTLRRMFNQPKIARLRRMVGLFAFAYVSLHLVAYAGLFVQFDLSLLLEDFTDRAYITAGIGAFVCLLPMAITSTRGWQRRLAQGWRRLHRLVYPAVALGLIHLWWLTRDGFLEVFVYVVWFAVLLIERGWRSNRAAPQPRHSAA